MGQPSDRPPTTIHSTTFISKLNFDFVYSYSLLAVSVVDRALTRQTPSPLPSGADV